jgi:hypothetical protein
VFGDFFCATRTSPSGRPASSIESPRTRHKAAIGVVDQVVFDEQQPDVVIRCRHQDASTSRPDDRSTHKLAGRSDAALDPTPAAGFCQSVGQLANARCRGKIHSIGGPADWGALATHLIGAPC